MTRIYATPAKKVGKHEWRMIVLPSRFGGNCTDFQFRPIGQSSWRGSHEWPTYNLNDGTYAGLPKSLRRLYDKHEAEIIAALEGHEVPQKRLAI